MKTTINNTKQMYTTYKWLFVLLFMGFGFISRGQWTTVQTNNFDNFPTGFEQTGFSNQGYGAETGGSSDKCAYDKNVGASPNSYVSIQANLESGYDYRFSFFAKRAETATCGLTLMYSVSTGNGGTSVSSEFTPPKRSGSQAGDNYVSNIIAGDGNDYYLKIVVTTGNSSDVKLRVDGFKLERKSASSTPTITVNPTSLTGFTYVEGNGPSSEQSFTVEGSNLTADISVTLPTIWEISTTSGGPYQTTAITLTQSGGTVNATTIYTRMVSGLLNANSPFSGNIVCASSGATDANVAVDGTVTLACIEPNQATAMTFPNTTASAIEVSWTASSGGADNYLVVQSTSSSLSASPVDGTTYSVGTSLGGGTVVYNSSSTSFADSGLSSNTTYYYYVFAYNDASCGGGPNYNTTSLDGNETTLNGPCLGEESFESGLPANWSQNGSYFNSGDAHTGSKKAGMNDVGDWIELEQVDNPASLDYWARLSSSPSSDNKIKVQYYDGASWQDVVEHTATSTSYVKFTADLSALTNMNNVRIRLYRSADNKSHYIDDVSVYCGTPGPEIEIQGNNTEIEDGATNSPSITNDTDFGATTVAGGTVAHTFTINNLGGADLNLTGTAPTYVAISGTNASDFSVTANPSTPIGAGVNTTFTITFDPSATGVRTATLTIANDDSDEGSYDFAIQGAGTNSNSSDIIENATFVYTSNIDYTSFQGDPITSTSNSVGVFKFDIRDGGGSADADALGTELTDITFDVLKIANIRNASLFDGNTKLADGTVGASSISFSGLSGADYTAPDDGTKSLTLRVSFKTTVTDNDQMQFAISSATANTAGSAFANSDAGGATSSITGDRNRIEVTATDLLFNQQPSNTVTNQAMNPSVTVDAVDANLNVDLDFTGTVNITSTGTLSAAQAESAASGTATFSNIVHTVAGTNLTLTATSTGLTQDVSNTFDIENFVNNTGDFRPKNATTFANNGDWEYYDGSAWGNVPDGKAPQNTSTTVTRILIDKYVNAAGSASHNYDCDIIVFSSGTLEITDDDNPPTAAEFLSTNNTLEVRSGGIIKIQGDIDLASSTNFILRNGAKMYIDQASMNNEHPMWDGVELFEGGSEVEINNWDWTASPAQRSLINVTTAIADNANGYKFGKVYFNPTTAIPSGKNWTIVGGPISVNVAENDFQINNAYSDYVSVMSNKTAGISATFGGDLIVDDGLFAFGSSYSSDTFDQTIVVKGNVLIGSDDDAYLHKALNGTPTVAAGDGQIKVEGNIEVWQMGTNTLTSDVDTKQILLTGDNSHTLYIDRNCSNMPLIVEDGDSAELVNSDLKFAGNSDLEIQSGATFNFGFNGLTALEVQNISGGSNTFTQKGGAYLYITHPQGIWDASANGNVQSFAASNTTYTQANSTYHYIGKTNQETGDAFTSASTSKTIICDLENNADELTVTATTGTSNLLDIRSGVVVNTDANHIFGSGDLTIAVNGGLKTSVLPATSNVPMLTGTYTINGGFIELNAAGDQILKGSNDYKDLIFSNSGTKTITSAIPNVDGTITVQNAAILDVENHQMGGAGTDLTMTDTAQYITDGTSGTGIKPDARGTYSLGVGTKVVFEGSGATLQKIRLHKNYYNIDIVGYNVGTETLSTPIIIQSGGTFTVKTGGTFKHKNTTGFNGATDTAIDNTNSPTISLEPGSTIEYYGASQSVTQPDGGYQSLIISGSGDKTLSPAEVIVNENLTVSSSRLLLEDNKGIEVQGNVLNEGAIEVNNQGAFVQTNDASTISGTGTFKMHKTSLPLDHYYDYVYWSSPINSSTFTLGDMVTGAWRYYKYDPNEANNGHTYPSWVMLSASDVPEAGSGYAVSAPTGAGAGTILNVQFTKGSDAFNNGVISRTVLRKGGPDDNGNYNLLGNPYPSAIDFDTLANDTDNDEIANSYSLWTNCRGFDANNHHQTTGYATYTASGTGTSACTGDDPANRYIASGQGFMIEANTDGGTMKFKNIYRVTDQNDHFLNRPQQRDILWLDMQDDAGNYSQIAVGFYTGATQAYDDGFDAHSLNTGSGFALYSLINEEKLVIQGLPEWNSVENVVPLGVESDNTRNIRFHINRTEGLFGTYIYLHDKELNITHDLTASDYVTNVLSGSLDNRFELVFTPQPMHQEEQQINPNVVLLTQNQGVFTLKAQENHQITGLKVYDISGRILFENNNMNTANYQMNLKQVATGNLLLFKVQIDGESYLVKKTIKE